MQYLKKVTGSIVLSKNFTPSKPDSEMVYKSVKKSGIWFDNKKNEALEMAKSLILKNAL